jgi:O-antigen/teichoic acid export membrane protein
MLDRRKLATDGAANIGALIPLAVSGIFINSIVVKVYGPAGLGVFNTVLAIYILGSQLATLGVQFSVLNAVAAERSHGAAILSSALVVVAATALGTCLLLYLLFGVIGAPIYAEPVRNGLVLALPGLWFFALNKVLLNALNGAEANKLYALLTGARHLLIAGGLAVFVAFGAPAETLPTILSIAEGALICATLCQARRIFPGLGIMGTRTWASRHVVFGLHSLPGGLATELNTRVDVLVLGLFVPQASIGLYSFAAFFVEGLLQFPVVARRLADPVLTRLYLAADRQRLTQFLVKGRNLGAAAMGSICLSSAVAYPWFATWLGDGEVAKQSWPVFCILLTGAFAYGSYAPMGGLFSQAGFPKRQSQVNLAILGLNLSLNFALVPAYGVIGAATATALSFGLGAQYFRNLVTRQFDIRF